MAKVLINVLSTVNPNAQTAYFEGVLKDGSFKIYEGIQTNVAPTNYVHDLCGGLDKIISVVTADAERDRINAYESKIAAKLKTTVISIENSYTDQELFDVAKQLVQEIDKDDEVYIDYTGGFRDAALVFVMAVRLLSIKQVVCKNVVYANFHRGNSKKTPDRIESKLAIYRVFDLISGMDEFIQYGSVKKLKEFYKASQDEKIKEAIEAMEDFSINFKLCRIADIATSSVKLKKALEPENDAFTDSLFLLLVESIRQKYNVFLQQDGSTAAVIRWCIENEYLQQALTFYEERIPGYLQEKEILNFAEFPPIEGFHPFYGRRQREIIEKVEQGIIFRGPNEKKPEVRGLIENYCKIRNLRCIINHASEATVEVNVFGGEEGQACQAEPLLGVALANHIKGRLKQALDSIESFVQT